MENTLAEERKLFAVYRCLQRQLADIRPSHECFFPRARKNQHAHDLVIPRIEQRLLQLFHRFAIQRIQHLRPIEGDVRNSVPLFVQNIFVTHLFPLLGSAFLGVLGVSALSLLFYFLPAAKTSSPYDSPDRSNHKTLVPTSARSI